MKYWTVVLGWSFAITAVILMALFFIPGTALYHDNGVSWGFGLCSYGAVAMLICHKVITEKWGWLWSKK